MSSNKICCGCGNSKRPKDDKCYFCLNPDIIYVTFCIKCKTKVNTTCMCHKHCPLCSNRTVIVSKETELPL